MAQPEGTEHDHDEQEASLQNRLRFLKELELSRDDDADPDVVQEKVSIAKMCCVMALERMCGTVDEQERAKKLLDAGLVLLRPGTIPAGPEVVKARGEIYANMGCLYQRVQRYRAALISNQKATALYRTLPHCSEELITTLLSEAALNCSSKKYTAALKCADEALSLCMALEEPGCDPAEMKFATLQAMCYHNVAVCQEYLGRFGGALSSYQTAVKLVCASAGKDHPLCLRLKASYADCYAMHAQRASGKHDASTSGRASAPPGDTTRSSAAAPAASPVPSTVPASLASLLTPTQRTKPASFNTTYSKRYHLQTPLPRVKRSPKSFTPPPPQEPNPELVKRPKWDSDCLLSGKRPVYAARKLPYHQDRTL
eukprot:TRINITY_DN22776_c0_g1_i1.p1 TRINITY_DN22776_c0_g1~~TRINITY_DN22776_c0_g1_i1.p1  ORF type:complete len:370 (+),score=114.32 TRINITY_DN22776_c0_g1_i1:101-1210(+)